MRYSALILVVFVFFSQKGNSESFYSEPTLEGSKFEVNEYLNSLSVEELVELHRTKVDIEKEVLRISDTVLIFGGAGLVMGGIIGAIFVEGGKSKNLPWSKLMGRRSILVAKEFPGDKMFTDTWLEDEKIKDIKGLQSYKRGHLISRGVMAAGIALMWVGLMTHKSIDFYINDEGLGLDDESLLYGSLKKREDQIRAEIRTYISNLTLEEAKEVLAMVKQLGEDLQKNTINRAKKDSLPWQLRIY